MLDGFLLNEELTQGNLTPRIYTYKPFTLKNAGHSILTLRWKAATQPEKGPSKPPTEAFKATFRLSHQVYNTMKFFETLNVDEAHFIHAWWNSLKTIESNNRSAINIIKSKLPKQTTHITLTDKEEKTITKELGEQIHTTAQQGKKLLEITAARKIVNTLIAKKSYRVYKDDNELLIKSFFQLNDNKKLWDKFRLIVPKFTGALCKLKREDNSFSEDPAELDTLVRKGREFWLEPKISCDYTGIIHAYSEKQQCRGRSAPVSDYSQTKEYFLKAILSSADSAPGIDNIPYAYYRANPIQQACRLHNKLSKILKEEQAPPQQLLVWIPKAEAGFQADNWRPLSMPVTWDRLIDQAAYAAIVPFFEAQLSHAHREI
jgi:hypothetical protein